MNIAVKTMATNQLALSVASNNIANANNPDYSRQRLLTQPAGPDGTRWHVGMGVEALGIEAVRALLIETRLRHSVSSESGADTLSTRLTSIESQFNDANGNGLLQSITTFFNSFQALSQDSASLPFREEVRTSARALVDALHTRQDYLSAIRLDAERTIVADVNEVNRLTRQIADVTREIKIQEVHSAANDLRDRRNAMVKELSGYLEVNELDSGDYQITTKDNRLLVLNDFAKPVIAADVTSTMGPGSLSAEVEIRDTYIPKYAAALDQLAYEISEKVNAIHSAAYDLDGNTNINFFEPLTAVPGAARLIELSGDVAADTRKIAASNLATGNDNGAAMELGNLLHTPVFGGAPVTELYSTMVFAIGSDLANAKQTMNEHKMLATQLQNRKQSISGVSIDEETVQILQFQRAYEASARLIKTVDELLQVTLSLGA
jgi:flagellar hook-associated protein 1 FlgK